MRKVKWSVISLLALLVLAFFHYTLPQHDIVRITRTFSQRMDLGPNNWFFASPDVGTEALSSRDIKFIETFRPNGRTMVYRNEDTGWGWPPYFKVNSFNLQAEAGDLVSTVDAPKWVAIKHYGWRNEFFTIFPNAVSVRQVAGPDVRIIPWVNIILLTTLAAILFMLRRMWLQFRERTIDPALEDAGDAWDAVDARADAARDRAKGMFARFADWLASWRDKSRR
ncbi:MAG: DUF1523 family protein [Paracoccaceae bacterium]|nr:DUF1523 family protein [Paracoccaceae bacterium]